MGNPNAYIGPTPVQPVDIDTKLWDALEAQLTRPEIAERDGTLLRPREALGPQIPFPETPEGKFRIIPQEGGLLAVKDRQSGNVVFYATMQTAEGQPVLIDIREAVYQRDMKVDKDTFNPYGPQNNTVFPVMMAGRDPGSSREVPWKLSPLVQMGVVYEDLGVAGQEGSQGAVRTLKFNNSQGYDVAVVAPRFQEGLNEFNNPVSSQQVFNTNGVSQRLSPADVVNAANKATSLTEVWLREENRSQMADLCRSKNLVSPIPESLDGVGPTRVALLPVVTPETMGL
jgi:hypothetical protein